MGDTFPVLSDKKYIFYHLCSCSSRRLPSIVNDIIEQKLNHLGAKKSERIRNIIMIYLAEKGYFREVCESIKQDIG